MWEVHLSAVLIPDFLFKYVLVDSMGGVQRSVSRYPTRTLLLYEYYFPLRLRDRVKGWIPTASRGWSAPFGAKP